MPRSVLVAASRLSALALNSSPLFLPRSLPAKAVWPFASRCTPKRCRVHPTLPDRREVLECVRPCGALERRGFTKDPTVTATNRSVQLPLPGNAQFFRLRQL